MTKSTKIAAVALIAAFATAPAFAAKIGNVETNVNAGKVQQSSKATLGSSENSLQAGNVSGTTIGNVKTNVNVKNVTQSSKATLGKSKNEIKLGSVD